MTIEVLVGMIVAQPEHIQREMVRHSLEKIGTYPPIRIRPLSALWLLSDLRRQEHLPNRDQWRELVALALMLWADDQEFADVFGNPVH